MANFLKDFLRDTHHGIMKLLRPSSIEVNGLKMTLDKRDTSEYSKGYEPKTTEIMKKMIKEGDTIIDVGACIGYYILLFAKLVGPKGRVFAFEPEIKNFKILKKNTQLNNLSNIVLVNKAVSDKEGKSKFYVNKYRVGSHHLQNEFDDRSYAVEVETITLDEFFKNYGRNIDLIKMDI
tara:strand:+ start:23568 stop:24101 length:534 start_codon:yes stop_codon:yes gene_type:complete